MQAYNPAANPFTHTTAVSATLTGEVATFIADGLSVTVDASPAIVDAIGAHALGKAVRPCMSDCGGVSLWMANGELIAHVRCPLTGRAAEGKVS